MMKIALSSIAFIITSSFAAFDILSFLAAPSLILGILALVWIYITIKIVAGMFV